MNDYHFPHAMGWLRDYPDFRDNTPSTNFLSEKQLIRGAQKDVRSLLLQLKNVGKVKSAKVRNSNALPASVDLRKWCSPIEDQGSIGSCTAHAGTAMYEYFERRAYGKHINASRLFLYKVTRNLLNWQGDQGAYLRTTMGAMAMFGLVPEKYWPYREGEFNAEPNAFHYSFAKNYQSLVYYRLDEASLTTNDLLQRIKEHLAMGLPSMFGFTCFSSLQLQQVSANGRIPFPSSNEGDIGGHAVLAVGYDDSIQVIHPTTGKKTVGAILIQNSWGTAWGEKGYGWLPYEYVLQGLAVDWWTMIKGGWIDTGNFGLNI